MERQNSENSIDEILKVRTSHDEAYMYISQGLSYEEQGENVLAKEMYARGIQKIENGLSVRCDRPYCIGERWDKIRNMQQKMRLTLPKIRSQLAELENNMHLTTLPIDMSDQPPSYEEACGYNFNTSYVNNNSSFSDDAIYCKQLMNGNMEKFQDSFSENTSHSIGAEELFSIANGVQIFFVSCDGHVSAPSYPTSLHIYKLVDNCMTACQNSPQAWLQIDNWMYPLDPGKSPVLHSGFGAYIFPDVSSNQTVGLILPVELDESTRDLFESLLVELTALKTEKTIWPTLEEIKSKDTVSHKISKGIVAGAEILSEGLTKGVEITNTLMRKGASKLREKVSPEEKPANIDPRVQKGVAIARNISGTVLNVSGYVVSKLGKMTVALSHQIAPHVRKQGERAMSAVFNTDSVDSQKKMDDVMIVAAGGLVGFATVYQSLENAARSLAYCLTNETVQIVNHKYGHDASNVVGNAMNAIGNLALTTHNVQSLGIKAIAKRTAKDTGKAVLKDYIDQTEHSSVNEEQTHDDGNKEVKDSSKEMK